MGGSIKSINQFAFISGLKICANNSEIMFCNNPYPTQKLIEQFWLQCSRFSLVSFISGTTPLLLSKWPRISYHMGEILYRGWDVTALLKKKKKKVTLPRVIYFFRASQYSSWLWENSNWLYSRKCKPTNALEYIEICIRTKELEAYQFYSVPSSDCSLSSSTVTYLAFPPSMQWDQFSKHWHYVFKLCPPFHYGCFYIGDILLWFGLTVFFTLCPPPPPQ